MQVIGFCRFSYPAEGGFQVEHASLEERIAYLYAPARMQERLRHFEAICLPGLRAQTDPDFSFVILVGDSLPTVYLDALTALVADVPQARIVARPPGPHRQVCAEVINAQRYDLSAPCLQFRHDDDDAVAVTFVARLREAAQDCAALLAQHRLVGFDWNRGWVARPDPQGLRAERNVTPYWGVAQAMAVRGGTRQTIMNFGHQKINLFMPTVTFTHEDMFVRGHNDHNDSRQKKHVTPIDLPRLDAAGETLMRDTFAIDADQVRRIFG
ncbi:putative rhamnosyl transferase [Puniceibacterium sp. IMCC21224]|uniref:putative rhamnosyl transferase n=1 Tax=Puniceibacterium sp. IMCC21224 TaxID=1618204 RepID=UPI00064DE4A2|nr:putative rhamnosyl transferase [Puniceibacterium sp. IMCC21224]KMK68164.1 putative rhamnosyl transferase [Puniceibacterium sp. IMCC21224]